MKEVGKEIVVTRNKTLSILSGATLSGAAVIALLPIAATAATGDEAKTCPVYVEEIRVEIKAGDLAKASEVYKSQEAQRVCAGKQIYNLGRLIALSYYKKAYAGSLPEAEQKRLLEEGLAYGRPWVLTAALGDIALNAKEKDKAVVYFTDALIDIQDPVATPTPPPSEVIQSISKKAQEAQILAENYHKQETRDGNPGGTACPSTRGFTSTKSSIPIEFAYKETTFTPKGQAAANDMYDYLTRQGAPDIELTGHTDPRGAQHAALSKSRAEAVAKFLKEKGYKGKVVAIGRGKSERYQPDDPKRYTQEELYQLDRRVELERKSGDLKCATE